MDLPDLKPPAAPQKPKVNFAAAVDNTDRALQGRSAGGWLDQMANDIQRSDPENAPILMAMLTAKMRQVTGDPTFNIPSQQDTELANLKFEKERLFLRREVAKGQIDEAYAAMLDNPALKKRGLAPDTLRQDPELFASVAQEMNFQITPGHFALAQDPAQLMAPGQAAKEKSAKDLSQTTGAVSDVLSLAKKAPELGSAERAEEGLEARGEQMGQDLFPPGWQFWTGPNAASWQGANRELESQLQQGGPVLGKFAAQGFLETLKGPLGDALGELPMQTIKTEGGGEQTVLQPTNDPMAQQAVAFALRVSQAGGIPIQDVLKAAGVDANAIDLSGLQE